jgi:transposase
VVLHVEIDWEDQPQELGFGSGMRCWRRLQRWTHAGVFDQVHQLLAKLNVANRIDWSGGWLVHLGGPTQRARLAALVLRHVGSDTVCDIPAWMRYQL